MKKSEMAERITQLELEIEILKLAVAALEIPKQPYTWPQPYRQEPYITWKDTTRPFADPNTTID